MVGVVPHWVEMEAWVVGVQKFEPAQEVEGQLVGKEARERAQEVEVPEGVEEHEQEAAQHEQVLEAALWE